MSSSDSSIAVRGLSKSYLLSHEPAHTTLIETALRRLRHPFRRAPRDTLWALRDITFGIDQGEVVGIIGRNGAGKSTLLKILSRITEPTSGEAELRGRVGSLLEVGTGFHPELTGRENVFLNGAILGMSRAQIHRQFDAIVDFAGVERFLDTPVKRYSSGMSVRLAFAVAAHLEAEILIVDEVLAVGDAEFQQKCLGKISDVAQSGRTVLLVSHNATALHSLCTRGIVLDRGAISCDAPIAEALAAYSQLRDETGGGIVRATSPRLQFLGLLEEPAQRDLSPGDDICVAMELQAADSPLKDVEIDVSIVNAAGQIIVHARCDVVSAPIEISPRAKMIARYAIQQPRLAPGIYTLTIYIRAGTDVLYWAEQLGMFTISPRLDFGLGTSHSIQRGATLPRYQFTIQSHD